MATTGRNRGNEASYDSSKNYNESQIDYGSPEVDIPNEPNNPEQPAESQQPAYQQPSQDAGGWYNNNYNYNYDAAAAEAAARAAEEARLERENEAKRRANDENIRENEIDKQRERRDQPDRDRNVERSREAQVYDQMERDGRISPIEGYEHLVQNEEGRIFPKGGEWTDEAIEEYQRAGENSEIVKSEDHSYFNRLANASIAESTQDADVNELEDTESEESFKGDYRSSRSDKKKWKPKNFQNSGDQDSSGKTYANRSRQKPEEQQQAQQPDPENETTLRSVIDKYMRDSFFTRSREARNFNKALKRRFKEEQRNDPTVTWEDFVEAHPLDQEAFQDSLRAINPVGYRRIREYEEGRALREEGQTSDVDDYMQRRGVGTKVKDMHKLWRLLDQTTWDMRIGFFHVGTEKLVTDEETNERHIEWSGRVEDAITNVMEDFGGSGIDGQRTVFRLVRLYATMAIDRQGKMFNENQNEWSLTQNEFIDICDCIHRSILMYGHPFVSPAFLTSSRGVRKTLRGTDMFPSGVVPRVVAEAITGPDSAIRFTSGPNKGQPMTADDLIKAAHDEWVNRTQPVMNASLTNSNAYKPKRTNKDGEEIRERNLVAQRIAVENALQAFARLDGMDADSFGSMYNIDTAEHYRLWEYQDSLVEYATAMNGQYDSDAVVQRQLNKLNEWRAKNSERRNRKQLSTFEASCNLISSGIKTNALWWNLPIRLSAIAERGVGNLQTFLTLQALRSTFKNPEQFQVPEAVSNAFMTREGYNSVDAAYLLLEIGGPGALMDFATTNKPMTQEEVISYLHSYILKEAETRSAYEIQKLNTKLNKAAQKILSGGHAFKHSTMTNFLTALMISNQATADTQTRLANNNLIDDYAGLALTGSEMQDVFMSHNGDVAWFLSEVCGTFAGRDALIMMNANNIAQFNVISWNVNKVLRDNGIGNAMITSFLDSFAGYGINFLYSMMPGSRTFTYLSLKQYEKDYDITAADFAIGGGLGLKFKGSSGFWNGLKMNLMFDCMTMAKWGLGCILIGGVFAALGFEPPDDPEDIINVSKWKIGKNVDLGPDTDGDGTGNGVEIALAFWTNDLTQWGLPLAYVFAASMSLPDDVEINGLNKSQIMSGLFTDCISEQFDGNVVLDIVDCIKNWGDDVIDIDQTTKDPNHKAESSPFFALSELGLRAFGKMVPGAPLYKAWGTSALLRGPEAEMFSTSRKYDKSGDWEQEVGKTDYIDDPMERLIRKYSAGNWLLAGIMNGVQMVTDQADTGTGYFWHQMPTRTKTEPFALALIDEFKMDYDHIPEGSTYESYRAQRTEDLKKYITDHYDDPEEAIRDGFFIPGDIRNAALNTTFSELNALKNEFDTKCDLQFETKSEYYDAKDAYDKQKQELWDWINKWFKNGDIPTWTENYKQILSDWDKTYVKADGSPATGLDALFDPSVKTVYKLKGNNPTSVLPFTWVNYDSTDKVSRGWSGETNPSWESDGSSFATIEALENNEIKVGRDAGSTVGDVYWGERYDGERLHRDDATIGERAWFFTESKLPESLRKIDETTCDGGIYGEMGKASKDGSDTKNGNDSSTKNPWKNDYGPNDKLPWKTSSKGGYGRKSFYSRSSYGRGKRSSSGNYNPKIYSSRAQTTHIQSTRVGSTRTSPNTRNVNNDRATTINTPNLQDARTGTYLRPGFSTKGSREAYKRQDI